MIELKTLPDNYELPEYFENRTKGFGNLIRDLHMFHQKEECLLDVISHAEFLLRKLKDKSITHRPVNKCECKSSFV